MILSESPHILFCCQYLTNVVLVGFLPRDQAVPDALPTLNFWTCEAGEDVRGSSKVTWDCSRQAQVAS